jgi:hypothetical protein
VFTGNTGVPIGHFAPYDLPDEIILDTKKQLELAVKAMELDNCAINADFILSNGKVYVLELGGRSGATCLAELVSIYYDFNYYEKIILAALGENPSFASDKSIPNASHLIISDKSGTIKSQSCECENISNIVEIQFDYKVGDKIRKFNVGPDRIGHIITTGSTIEECKVSLEKALNSVKVEL